MVLLPSLQIRVLVSDLSCSGTSSFSAVAEVCFKFLQRAQSQGSFLCQQVGRVWKLLSKAVISGTGGGGLVSSGKGRLRCVTFSKSLRGSRDQEYKSVGT